MEYGADKREEFLKALENTPFIGSAARKVGISRMTIYRWMHDDPEFKRATESVLKVSRERISEKAESVILKRLDADDFGAAKFFLTHNSKHYSEKIRSQDEKIPLMDKFDDYFEFGPDYQMEMDLERLRRVFMGPDGKFRIRELSIKKFLEEVERARKQELIQAFSDESGNIRVSKVMAERLKEKYPDKYEEPTNPPDQVQANPTDSDTVPPNPETSA